jgi:hypothetical protein
LRRLLSALALARFAGGIAGVPRGLLFGILGGFACGPLDEIPISSLFLGF